MGSEKRIIVTGAGGLIGSYAARELSAEGFDVLGIYRQAPKIKPPWSWMVADLRKVSLNGIEPTENDTIVHCAAHIPVTFSNSEYSYKTNKRIDENILSVIDNYRSKLVYISSTSVYGKTNRIIHEEDPVQILNLYSQGKYETEQRILELNSSKKIILRINAPYAPEQRSNTVLKIFIERGIKSQPLFYHGEGTREQDFTAASDIASSIVRSCITDETTNSIFNISSARPISMRGLGSLVVSLIPGCTSTVEPSGANDDQENYRANFAIQKAVDVLKWRPKMSLEKGIINWINYLNNENRLH